MSPIMTDIQKISVTLSETDLTIEPGQTAQIVVTLTNRQDAPDRLSIEVEGLDVEWYAIPVPAVNLAPGAQSSERVLFKLSRSSASRAGHYPFLVRVQAMETGEVGVAQATLAVKPFSDLQLELTPKRGLATFFRPLNEFQVTLANLGNAEETLDLYANDPDDECAYEFDTERMTLKPGQNEVINLAMRPKTTAFLGGMKLYGFTVSARATADAYVSASSHGQLEKRALVSPLSGIFLILLALGSGLTYAFWPHPPPAVRLIKFNSNQPKIGDLPARVQAGAEVRLSWNAENAKQILLYQKVGKQEEVLIPDQPAPLPQNGTITVKPEAPSTTYRIAVNGEGANNDKKDYVTINVTPLPPAPQPKITSFRATPAIIHQGEPITLQWEARGADKLILDPGNMTMSGYTTSQEVHPDGDTTYTLRAFGRDEKAVVAQKNVSVRVVSKDVCIAQIINFHALTRKAYLNESVQLTWRIINGNGSLTSDKGPTPQGTTASGGVIATSAPLTGPTTFTLTATDSAGKIITKDLIITPVERPLPPPPPPVVTPGNGGPAGTEGGPSPPIVTPGTK